jgi:hypothetical protein
MSANNGESHPPATASTAKTPDTSPVSAQPISGNGEQREVIELLQRIVQLLDDIDGSLANIEGKLDQIHARMP